MPLSVSQGSCSSERAPLPLRLSSNARSNCLHVAVMMSQMLLLPQLQRCDYFQLFGLSVLTAAAVLHYLTVGCETVQFKKYRKYIFINKKRWLKYKDKGYINMPAKQHCGAIQHRSCRSINSCWSCFLSWVTKCRIVLQKAQNPDWMERGCSLLSWSSILKYVDMQQEN